MTQVIGFQAPVPVFFISLYDMRHTVSFACLLLCNQPGLWNLPAFRGSGFRLRDIPRRSDEGGAAGPEEAAMMAEKKKATRDSIIGDVIRDIPGAKEVIQRHFGGGCFTCPGINMESISFGAMMHNIDPGKIVDEINSLEG